MSMNEILASMYGTANTATSSQEDLAKTAAEELFVKAAEAQGVNLSAMSDEQVSELFDLYTAKLAEEEGDDDDEKKKEKAEKEHQEKKAAQEKFAEADFAGRQMAHAYIDEMKKIASSSQLLLPSGSARDRAFSRLRDGAEKLRNGAKSVADGAKNVAKKPGVRMGAAGIAGAAVGAGAAHAAHSRKGDEKKEASAIDQLAYDSALSKVAAAGYDPEEAGARINAAFTLGMFDDDTKIAAAADTDQAIDIRSLEMLEAAGYPVTWNV